VERVDGWVVVCGRALGSCVVCIGCVLCANVLVLLLSSADDGTVDSGRAGRTDLVATDVESITSLHAPAATTGREVKGGQCDGIADGWHDCVGGADGMTGAVIAAE